MAGSDRLRVSRHEPDRGQRLQRPALAAVVSGQEGLVDDVTQSQGLGQVCAQVGDLS